MDTAGSLGERGRDAGSGRFHRPGPAATTSGDDGEQEAGNQRHGRAGARPGRPRRLMRVGASTRGWRSSCP
jgi:hypothetical protein